MLKIQEQKTAYFTTQAAHAELSGYFAAHWGNSAFARPGFYADLPADKAQALSNEVIFAIAQHDNGWWESDAYPRSGPDGGLPEGLLENMEEEEAPGLDRWIRGVERYVGDHPYASLLISFHAYWLYAPKAGIDDDPIFASDHPVQKEAGADEKLIRRFAQDLAHRQKSLMLHMRRDAEKVRLIQPDLLNPHIRLLQTLDSLSLSLCSQIIQPDQGEAQGLGRDTLTLRNVPRKGWDDLVDLKIRPGGRQEIIIDPYPFDQNPLPVDMPIRTISQDAWKNEPGNTVAQWHRSTRDILSWQFRSA